MTLKYKFSSQADRELVVEVLREAADHFNGLADDVEDDPAEQEAHDTNRHKGEDCHRLANEIEKDMVPTHPRRSHVIAGGADGDHFGDD